ncbi:MAG TPA: PA2169 family four-helix-bundle protein [Caulobacteraceae bacterium]|nr:PA2169 family four-helix-bundle protein [Caulobacteraceae bacterium]
MESRNEHAVDVLNRLIETTLDSANGYREAASHLKDPRYKTLFTERATKRMELSRRLQEEVRTFGGRPKDEQSFAGKTHSSWVALKDKLGAGDKGIIDEVERGEDTLKSRFQKATSETDLPPTAREVVTSAYASVKADHDEISRLKHQLH